VAAIDDFLAEYGAALHEQAKLVVEAEHQEHMRKVVLAEVAVEIGGAVASAENRARASERYQQQLEVMRAARAAAETARAKVTHLAARLEVWRTKSADQREKLKHQGGY
jgi:hypothetical protein